MRHYDFMLKGLKEVEQNAARLGIPFVIRAGSPADIVTNIAVEFKASMVVTDFSPLRIHMQWKHDAALRLCVPLVEADTHNIVPCRFVSGKQEFAARTLRPKIHKLLPGFLHEIPPVVRHRFSLPETVPSNDWDALDSNLEVDRSVLPVSSCKPGESAAAVQLREFLDSRLAGYASDKNDPSLNGLSGLSPYLHFGQLSSQRVALEVRESPAGEGMASFLEELIVRKELSDNFCLYNPGYDSYEGIPAWGKKTLGKHWDDNREYLYSLEEFESAGTHDPLWNAAQQEMVTGGKMHGYMRMYWAKKILEWSRNPEEAFHIAVYLNDRYSLDGRDPNGYSGISWSIGGTHDRPWGERPVFGNIRYMSYEGCRRKFEVGRYIKMMDG
jgi:deoxyribodipyrimidine photo-lyase